VTWNDASDTFTAWKLNVSDTASAGNSALLDLQVGGQTKLFVRKSGVTFFSTNFPTDSGLAIVPGGSHQAALHFNASNLQLGSDANNILSLAAGAAFLVNSGAYTGWSDARFYRDAADVIAQRDGANAQTFRWYRTFTDASNYERGALKTQSGIIELAAETAGTGTDDLDLQLSPAGAGLVRFGTRSALSGETVTGYIIIKDAGGTSRKLAVVS
jgi:hypothetical protein